MPKVSRRPVPQDEARVGGRKRGTIWGFHVFRSSAFIMVDRHRVLRRGPVGFNVGFLIEPRKGRWQYQGPSINHYRGRVWSELGKGRATNQWREASWLNQWLG